MTSFAEALAERHPLVLNAAMGTRLSTRGRDGPTGRNLDDPEEVRALHGLDVAAGADVLFTNTFAVPTRREWRTIVSAGVRLAREAAGPQRFVVGSIAPVGPIDHRLSLAEAMVAQGADGLVLETFTAPEAVATLATLKGHMPTEVPIVVSLWRWRRVITTARELQEAGAAAIGCNCQVGMGPMRRWVRMMKGAIDLPLMVKPSACLPGAPPASARSFEAAVPELLGRGACLFGGCCGTTNEHVAALRRALDRRAVRP